VKILEKQYEKGDLVYVLDTAIINGKCKNLSPPWKGPGVTNTVFLPFFFILRLNYVLSPIQLNLTLLKPNRYFPVPTRLETVMIGSLNDPLKFNRSCINRSTGFTPNMLMLGRETNQPADLMLGVGQDKIYSGSDEYVMGLEKAIRNAHEVARNKLNST
jgi:hypothetical protein